MTSEPIPGLTAKEAAVILDVTSESVHKYVCAGIIHKGEKNARGGLDRDTVEQVSLTRLPLRRRPGPHPYWATTREAAEVLGVSRARVRQLAESAAVSRPSGARMDTTGTSGGTNSRSSPTPARHGSGRMPDTEHSGPARWTFRTPEHTVTATTT